MEECAVTEILSVYKFLEPLTCTEHLLHQAPVAPTTASTLVFCT